MIIVQLKGGMGNQMFQYALGRSLAHERVKELKLDTEWYKTQSLRKYDLHHFDIKESFAKGSEIPFFIYGNAFQRALGEFRLKIGATRFGKDKIAFIRERQRFDYNPSLFSRKGSLYLQGSWQNEHYFKAIRPVLLQEFGIKTPLAGKNLEFARHIERSLSVSIHVRRGDYVSNPATRKFHGVCTLEYYREAIDLMKSRMENPVFFVFTDDQQWVKRNLSCHCKLIFVDCNDEHNAHQDLRLMYKCRHNIIANSSFSWWGAWLNPNDQKIVIAPKKWFAAPVDTEGLIPKKWLLL